MRRITNKSNQQLQQQKFEEFLEKSWTNKYIYTYTLTHTHEWKMELIWILKEEKRGTRWNKRERERMRDRKWDISSSYSSAYKWCECMHDFVSAIGLFDKTNVVVFI